MKKLLVIMAFTLFFVSPVTSYAIDVTPDAPPEYTHG